MSEPTTQPILTLTTAEAISAAESLQRLGKMLKGIEAASAFFKDAGSALNARDELDRAIEHRRGVLATLEQTAALAEDKIRAGQAAASEAQAVRADAEGDAARIVAAAGQRAVDLEADARQRAEQQAQQIVEQAQIEAGRVHRKAQEVLQAAEATRADVEARMQRLQQQAANLLGSA